MECYPGDNRVHWHSVHNVQCALCVTQFSTFPQLIQHNSASLYILCWRPDQKGIIYHCTVIHHTALYHNSMYTVQYIALNFSTLNTEHSASVAISFPIYISILLYSSLSQVLAERGTHAWITLQRNLTTIYLPASYTQYIYCDSGLRYHVNISQS